ncbi:unnamed protein product [Aspergillus oryzae var. brunneus]|uniref:Unnamed protein product n=1 Tax=Aspergillus oryzae var. brunneus TaxID=332754 RepID=A0ABQ6L994_ASPOZ|nr:unnamed protein product [Aspergillus oryzae var. brunneus]
MFPAIRAPKSPPAATRTTYVSRTASATSRAKGIIRSCQEVAAQTKIGVVRVVVRSHVVRSNSITSIDNRNAMAMLKPLEPVARWNQGTGYRVVNAIDDQYCCGNVVSIDNTSIECAVDRAFTVPIGTVMPGVAALANYTKSSTSSSSSPGSSSSGNSSSDASGDTPGDHNDQSARLAIGLGLGIPLGLIAGSALIWGAWERKQRSASMRELEGLKASLAAAGPPNVMGYNYQHGHGYAPVPAAPPTELGQYPVPVSELDSAGAKDSTRR